MSVNTDTTPESVAAGTDDARSIELELRAAFTGMRRPRTLAKQRAMETDDMERELAGKAWDALGSAELLRHRAALAMLDAPAFAYYLPAFLLASLDEAAPGFNQDLRETALFALSPYLRSRGPDAVSERMFRERTADLDERQRGAIRRYLRFVRTQVARPKAFPALDLDGAWK